jgi:hypothetical protein
MPWLERLDGRLRVALDWRDPRLARLQLMCPVTIGLGLINLNAVIGTLFAATHRPDDRPERDRQGVSHLHAPAGMFSVAVATVLFPRSRGSPRGRHGTAFGHGRDRPAPDRVPARTGECHLRRARRADRAPRLPARRVHPDQTPIVASALAAFSLGLAFNGAMLLSTGVLQPPGTAHPDARPPPAT